MMELPETLTLARQLEETVRGARILAIDIAEKRPKFLFTNEDLGAWGRKPIKAFLVHEGNVCGIGNGYLQDILHRAKLSPKRKVSTPDRREQDRPHRAILDTMSSASARGGRDTEKDLFGAPGRYVPVLDRRAPGTPCPDCGVLIQKISFLGGWCYVRPRCQPAP